MIVIEKPYIEQTSEEARLCAKIFVHGEKKQMYFSVAAEYGAFLCEDRADAFLAAMLPMAFISGTDIQSVSPISRRLLYQFRQYLIPATARQIPEWNAFRINAEPTDILLNCGHAVGTGWTGGVDSMYTMMQALNASEPGFRLTHLLIANNGALESNNNEELLSFLVQKARKGIAKDTGTQVVGVDTNLREWYEGVPYLSIASYLLPACVIALQKLFGVFYNSAGYSFDSFSFDVNNSAYYELFILHCLCTDTVQFYSAYGAKSRIEKLMELSDFPLAQRYLHPCIYSKSANCGSCGKCLRTQMALYGLGTLRRFSGVFDLGQFEKHFDENMAKLLLHSKNQHNAEVLRVLQYRGIAPSEREKKLERMMRAAENAVKKFREGTNK